MRSPAFSCRMRRTLSHPGRLATNRTTVVHDIGLPVIQHRMCRSPLYLKRLPCHSYIGRDSRVYPSSPSPPPYSNGPTHHRPSPVQASVILRLLLASMPHAVLAWDRRKQMRLTARETAPSCGAPGKRGGGRWHRKSAPSLPILGFATRPWVN